MAHDVFISYSTKDKAIADDICAALEAQTVRCWIAPRNIPPGADRGEAVLEALSGCRVVVLVFSSDANESRQVKREVKIAFEGEAIVIPFRVEDVMPSRGLMFHMKSVQWLNALTPPLEPHLEALAQQVQLLLTRAGVGPDSSAEPGPDGDGIESGKRTETQKEPDDVRQEEKHSRTTGDSRDYWKDSASQTPVKDPVARPVPAKAKRPTPKAARAPGKGKKPASRAPAALAAALALGALAGALGLVNSSRHTDQDVSAAAPSPTNSVPAQSQSDDADTRQAIQKAIFSGDDAAANADRTLDTSGLSAYFAEDELDGQKSYVEQLRQQGQYEVSSMQQEPSPVQSITVEPDGQNAQVSLTEVWDVTTYTLQTRKIVGAPHRDTLPQTDYLHYYDDGWKTYKVVNH